MARTADLPGVGSGKALAMLAEGLLAANETRRRAGFAQVAVHARPPPPRRLVPVPAFSSSELVHLREESRQCVTGGVHVPDAHYR